jgi:MoaA/NifB/PqqE/SkfB family radical SAM enzyme
MLNMPKVVDIELELTTMCNAKCGLCYRNYTAFKEHYPEKKVRPLVDIIKQLDEFPDLEWIRLVGTISEPTLYKDFFGLVKYIKGRGINIEICTNGDTHKPAWWSKLATLMDHSDKVYFSICGSTQELHEIYRTNTKLENILANARAFRSSNKNDYAQCIRFHYNSENFDSQDFKDMVSEFSHVYWTETFLQKEEENYVDKTNLDKLMPNSNKIDDYIHMDKFARAKFKAPVKGRAYCMSWENKSQQIDIDGKVYPCYLFLEASAGKPWDGDYQKILNMQHEVCKYCDRAVIELCDKKDLRYII